METKTWIHAYCSIEKKWLFSLLDSLFIRDLFDHDATWSYCKAFLILFSSRTEVETKALQPPNRTVHGSHLSWLLSWAGRPPPTCSCSPPPGPEDASRCNPRALSWPRGPPRTGPEKTKTNKQNDELQNFWDWWNNRFQLRVQTWKIT